MPAAATCCSRSSAASRSTATPSATAPASCANTATSRARSSTSCSRRRSPTTRPAAGGGCRRSAPASAATARCCAGVARDSRGRAADLPRVLEPETLDHLAPDDPAAQRSRRDLRRVNRFMGARRILARALARVVAPASAAPLRIIELGCGDGLLMLDVAGASRRAADVELDAARPPAARRAPRRSPPTPRPAGAPKRSIADVLDWAAASDADERWDVVVANLFLHHFEGEALRAPARRLRAPRRRARRLRAAAQPPRSPPAT